MSRILKLYPQGLPSVVEQTGGLERDPNCRRCELHYNAGKSVCLPFRGEPGGLLTIGTFPDGTDLQAGQPNQGRAGRYLNDQIARYWDEPIAHGLALGCPPPQGEPNPKQLAKAVGACRPYVAQWIRDVQPTRILALGGLAIQSLLGRSPPINSVRRGFGWYTDADWLIEDHDDPPLVVPIIFLMHPAAALRQGKFAQRAFESDLEWALRTPDSFFQERYRLLATGTVEVIETEAEAERVFSGYRRVILNDPEKQRAISWDVENRGQLYNPETFKLVSSATCLNGSASAAVMDRHALRDPKIVRFLVDSLHDPALRWVNQAPHDERVAMFLWSLPGRATPIAGERRDVRLTRKLVDTTTKASLDLLSELVGSGGYKIDNEAALRGAFDDVKKYNPRQTALFDVCPDPQARELLYQAMQSGVISTFDEAKLYLYALLATDLCSIYDARDAVATGLVDCEFYPQVQATPNLKMVWDEIEMPVSRSYVVSEHWGTPIDRDRCNHMVWYADSQQEQLAPQLRKYCGPDLLLSSPQKVGAFIFGPASEGGLGVRALKTTKKTGRAATNKEAMAAVADAHPFCRLYSQYTHFDRIREKAQEFLKYLCPDGRVHPTFLTDGTATGRSACYDPNLYSISRASKHKACGGKGCDECDDTGSDTESRMERDCIAAPPGWEIVDVDASQIELRGMAVVSHDPFMTQAFLDDADLHQRSADTATELTGVVVDRDKSKMVNFGSGYDLTDIGLAKRLGCSVKVAAAIQQAVLGLYTEMVARKEAEKVKALQCGYAYTVWGPDHKEARHRPMFELGSEDAYVREDALRAVWATLIQGSFSGDKVKEAHAQMVSWILKNKLEDKIQVFLSVYDSIISCARKDYVPLTGFMTSYFMTRIPLGYVTLPDGSKINFPQKCDMKVGPTYGRVKKQAIPKTLAEALSYVKR